VVLEELSQANSIFFDSLPNLEQKLLHLFVSREITVNSFIGGLGASSGSINSVLEAV